MNFLFKPSYYLLIALSFITLNCSRDSDDGDVETTNSNSKQTAVIINNETGTKETGNTPNIPVNPVVVTDTPTDSDNNNNNTGNNTDNTTENNITTPIVRVLTQEESAQLNFATFTIFNKSSSSSIRTNARKWTMSINLFLSGAFSNKEINFINEFSSELASISSNIVLNIVPSKDQSNVEVYFATQEDYRRDRPNFIKDYRPSSPTISGRATTFFSKSTNIINRGLIWIDPSAKKLQSIIKHELIHLLGFGHTNDANSIMKPTPEVDPTLSDDDVFAIHTLYNDLIKANFIENEIRSTVENNIESFFD